MRRLPKRSAGWRAARKAGASRARRAERRRAGRALRLLLPMSPLAAAVRRVIDACGHLAELIVPALGAWALALEGVGADKIPASCADWATLTVSARRLAPRGGKALQGCR